MTDTEQLRKALRQIQELDLGERPASMSEAQFAHAHVIRMRFLARDALVQTEAK